jgi:glycine betaine/proline transport system ATP-binding protein
VTGDTQLADLFAASVESDLPVVVIDDKQRLLGVIPRVTLLGALGNIPTNTGELPVIEPLSTIPMDVITQTLLATGGTASDTLVYEEGGAR